MKVPSTSVIFCSIDAAAALGKKGNIVKRYKAIEDLKHGNKVYDLRLSLDRELIKAVLEEQCAEYDVMPVNNTITRVDGEFVIEEGQTGIYRRQDCRPPFRSGKILPGSTRLLL